MEGRCERADKPTLRHACGSVAEAQPRRHVGSGSQAIAWRTDDAGRLATSVCLWLYSRILLLPGIRATFAWSGLRLPGAGLQRRQSCRNLAAVWLIRFF